MVFVDGNGERKAKVVVVCCGGLVVGGRRLRMGVRRCLRGGVVEVKG